MDRGKLFFTVIICISFLQIAHTQSIEGGWKHSLILCDDGIVWACGSNDHGQLGDSLSMEKLIPEPISGLENIVSVSAGHSSSFALDDNGKVWSWGSNEFGQLGLNSSIGQIDTPTEITTINTVKAISAGWFTTLFLLNDGSVWGCGRNDMGQLGNDTISYSPIPIQIEELSNILDIAAGYLHNLVLKDDSTVWAWGANYWGQLGDGTTSHSIHPVKVLNLTSVISIAIGWDHSLAVVSNGNTYSWGSNLFGQLGTGEPMINQTHPTPVQILSLIEVKSIHAEEHFSQVIINDGSVWMFGRNDHGQLGNNSTINSNIPIKISDISNIVQISAGGGFSLAIDSNGSVLSWGENSAGQLGDSTLINKLLPVIMTLGCNPMVGYTESPNTTINRIQISPNPCKGTSIIEFDNSKFENYSFKLYNSNGLLVLKIPEVKDGKIMISCTNFETGIYLFTITAQNKYFGSGKLIIE